MKTVLISASVGFLATFLMFRPVSATLYTSKYSPFTETLTCQTCVDPGVKNKAEKYGNRANVEAGFDHPQLNDNSKYANYKVIPTDVWLQTIGNNARISFQQTGTAPNYTLDVWSEGHRDSQSGCHFFEWLDTGGEDGYDVLD